MLVKEMAGFEDGAVDGVRTDFCVWWRESPKYGKRKGKRSVFIMKILIDSGFDNKWFHVVERNNNGKKCWPEKNVMYRRLQGPVSSL